MPTVRKIDPPPPVVRRGPYERTFDERYPVLEPPPFAALDAAIAAAPESLTPIAPGAIVAAGRGVRAVVLAEQPGACDLYLSDGVELRLERAGLLPIGRLPRISWVASQTKEGAWLAKFYRGTQETSRHFAVRRYGGLARALCAAVAATAEEWPAEGDQT